MVPHRNGAYELVTTRWRMSSTGYAPLYRTDLFCPPDDGLR